MSFYLSIYLFVCLSLSLFPHRHVHYSFASHAHLAVSFDRRTPHTVTRGGTIEQKLSASFKMFDTDGNGTLDPSEVREMFTLIINQRRAAQNPGKPLEPMDPKIVASINSVVREVFEKVDKNKSGSISLEEFMAGFNEYPEICGFFKQF